MEEIYLGQMGHPVESYNPKKLLESIRECIEVQSAEDPESTHERIEVISLIQILQFIMGYQGYCGVDTSDLFETTIDGAHKKFTGDLRNAAATDILFNLVRAELLSLAGRKEIIVFLNMGNIENRGLLPLNLYDDLDAPNRMLHMYEILTLQNLQSIYISYNKVS